MKLERWQKTGGGLTSEFGVFRVRRYRARSPRTGEERPISVIDSDGWVNVVPVTPENEIVFVRQFRHGTQAFTLEIPGGLVDPGEDPAEAARRELLEETGYAGGEPSLLGIVEPNPAILSNRCHTYLVRDAALVGQPSLEPGEDVVVATLPVREVPLAIADGRIAHALVICAFWWFFQQDCGQSYDPKRSADEV
jgi:8-oxo-dGTP pyrophosphatase MutT (NUDIX family)